MTAPEAPSDGRMACTRASSAGAGMPRPISGHTWRRQVKAQMFLPCETICSCQCLAAGALAT
jgi:hypothetical protein